MRCGGCVKLGFSARDDLARLEAALPGTAAAAAGFVDLQPLARRAMGLPRRLVPGLSAACSSLLGVGLAKEQRALKHHNVALAQRPCGDEAAAEAVTRVGDDARVEDLVCTGHGHAPGGGGRA